MTRLRSTRFLWLAMFAALAAHAQEPAPKTSLFRCAAKSAKDAKTVVPKQTIQLNSSGESVEGPVCAEVSLNALRYGAEFGATITETAGPNLGSVFPAAFTSRGHDSTTNQQAAVSVAADKVRVQAHGEDTLSLEFAFRSHQRDVHQRSQQLVFLQGANRTAAATLDADLRALRGFVTQSDGMFRDMGAAGVVSLIKSDAFTDALDDALLQRTEWSTSDELIDALHVAQAGLNALPVEHSRNTDEVTGDHCTPANIWKLGWTDWYKCREADYKQAMATLTQMLADASQFSSDRDKAAMIARKLGVATYWKTTSDALTPDDFIRQVEVTCPALFNSNREVALKLVMSDRVPSFDLQAETVVTKENILIVKCGSPFSISVGAAFSGVPNKEFAIVKGPPAAPATASTSKFEVLSNPQVHPLPMAIVQARVLETAGHRVALHASFGVGMNVRSQASGGSSPEFLFGPSVSFLRTVYLTAGAVIGRSTTKLAGGFNVGDAVPTEVTAPSVVTSYATRFGFAVTFTKQ